MRPRTYLLWRRRYKRAHVLVGYWWYRVRHPIRYAYLMERFKPYQVAA